MSWLILTSGLVTIGGTNNQAWPTQVVVAFASGLSEPAFLNIVGRVMSPPTVIAGAALDRGLAPGQVRNSRTQEVSPTTPRPGPAAAEAVTANNSRHLPAQPRSGAGAQTEYGTSASRAPVMNATRELTARLAAGDEVRRAGHAR